MMEVIIVLAIVSVCFLLVYSFSANRYSDSSDSNNFDILHLPWTTIDGSALETYIKAKAERSQIEEIIDLGEMLHKLADELGYEYKKGGTWVKKDKK